MLSRSEIANTIFTIVLIFCSLQKSHTGVHGGTGLLAVKHVEEVYPSEGGIATSLNVHTLFIRIVLVMIMKRRNALSDVAQVSVTVSYCYV